MIFKVLIFIVSMVVMGLATKRKRVVCAMCEGRGTHDFFEKTGSICRFCDGRRYR